MNIVEKIGLILILAGLSILDIQPLLGILMFFIGGITFILPYEE